MPFDLSGGTTGWGWNVSSNLKASASDVLRLQFTIGEGIQNDMNDSPVDIGIATNNDRLRPFVGEPLPIVAIELFLDHTWSEKFSTAVGYSWQDNDNTDGQAPERLQGWTLRTGQSAVLPRFRTSWSAASFSGGAVRISRTDSAATG